MRKNSSLSPSPPLYRPALLGGEDCLSWRSGGPEVKAKMTVKAKIEGKGHFPPCGKLTRKIKVAAKVATVFVFVFFFHYQGLSQLRTRQQHICNDY